MSGEHEQLLKPSGDQRTERTTESPSIDSNLLLRLAEEEVRIRSLMEKMERGGVVTHIGLREQLQPLEDRSMDAGTEVGERELELSMFTHFDTELAAIDRARERVRNGTYGKCVRCGEPISPERLDAIVFAEHCVSHG